MSSISGRAAFSPRQFASSSARVIRIIRPLVGRSAASLTSSIASSCASANSEASKIAIAAYVSGCGLPCFQFFPTVVLKKAHTSLSLLNLASTSNDARATSSSLLPIPWCSSSLAASGVGYASSFFTASRRFARLPRSCAVSGALTALNSVATSRSCAAAVNAEAQRHRGAERSRSRLCFSTTNLRNEDGRYAKA